MNKIGLQKKELNFFSEFNRYSYHHINTQTNKYYIYLKIKSFILKKFKSYFLLNIF